MQTLEPRTRRWTKAEYYQMAELGWFEGQRVELVEGEVVVMSAQNFAHVRATSCAARALEAAVGPNAWVRTQMPFDLGTDSDPEPDVSVVPGKLEDYSQHPKTAYLIVEVSESTLSYDRQKKGAMYAKASVPEYWIVNLVDRQLEVYRDPIQDSAHPTGFRYKSVTVLTATESITPLALPGVQIQVAELLG